MAGCDTVVMNPSGDIAAQQARLIVTSTVLMLLIIVPVIVLMFLGVSLTSMLKWLERRIAPWSNANR